MRRPGAGRRRPRLAAALLVLATGVPLADALLGGHAVDTPWFTLTVAAAGYLAGAWLSPVAAAAGVGAGAGVLTGANQVAHPEAYTVANDLFFFVVLLGGTALAGALLGARAAQVRELRRLSELREVQHAAELEAARIEQRNRLDAEVAGSLVRRLAVLEEQASRARQAPPAERRDALRRIEGSGREALDALRDVVGSLRAPEAPAPREAVEGASVLPPLGWVDVLVACSGVPVAVEAVTTAAARGPAPAAALAGAALGVPLLWRRGRPVTAAAGLVVVATATSAVLTPLPTTVTVLAPLSLAGYAVGAHARGPRLLVGAAVLVAGIGATALVSPAADRDPAGVAPTLVWLALALLAGLAAARHGARATRVEALLAEVAAGRGQELRLARALEAQALARDLHDTVAHAMTVVCLHAGVGLLPGCDEDRSTAAVATIESAVRAVRATVRTRSSDLAPPPVTPPADLASEVGSLASGLGLRPVVQISGDASRLPVPLADLVLRVVREGLVNVARHAGGGAATVRVDVGVDLASVVVVNAPGEAVDAGIGTGTGLLGLAELVAGHGGTLVQGPEDDGGFRLAVALPVRAPVTA